MAAIPETTQPIAWAQVSAAITSANGIPTAVTDGLETYPQREVHYLFAFARGEQEITQYSGRVWVMYNGVWARINELDHLCCTGVLDHSVCGRVPVKYPQRVYLEVCSIDESETTSVTPYVGVTVPGWINGGGGA